MGRIVLGEGPQKPILILVGEAPGQEEEKQGRPFVGVSGKFLRAALSMAGIDLKKCYFTNVVKVRPVTAAGANRKPNKQEIAKHLPRLKKELSDLPDVPVVLLGQVALGALLGPGYRVSRLHGQMLGGRKRSWFISYHPSAALRFAKIRSKFLRDIKFLKNKL